MFSLVKANISKPGTSILNYLLCFNKAKACSIIKFYVLYFLKDNSNHKNFSKEVNILDQLMTEKLLQEVC